MPDDNEQPIPARHLILRVIAFMVILTVLLTVTGAVLKPTRNGSSFGGPWPSFQSQPKDSLDVVFFGTSHAFTAVDPSTIWQERGIPTFVLAGPTQRMKITRYYVAEALRKQDPDVVAIEMVGLTYPPDRFNEKFHLLNVGYMPPSVNRMKAVLFATPWSAKTGVLSDIWTYHGRWTQLEAKDFDIFHKQEGHEYLRGWIPLHGNHKEVEVVPVHTATETAAATLTPTFQSNMPALREIARMCADRDIELLLFLAPTGPPTQYSKALAVASRELENEFGNVHVLDLSEKNAVADLDYKADFYDGGHLNSQGAQKTSRMLGDYLASEFGLPDRRRHREYAGWNLDARERDEYVAEATRKAKVKAKPVPAANKR